MGINLFWLFLLILNWKSWKIGVITWKKNFSFLSIYNCYLKFLYHENHSVCKGAHVEKVCPFKDKDSPLLPNSSAAISNGNSLNKGTGSNIFKIAKEG